MQKEDEILNQLREWITRNEDVLDHEVQISSKELKFYWLNRYLLVLKNDLLTILKV